MRRFMVCAYWLMYHERDVEKVKCSECGIEVAPGDRFTLEWFAMSPICAGCFLKLGEGYECPNWAREKARKMVAHFSAANN